jgi:hypothetical protein
VQFGPAAASKRLTFDTSAGDLTVGNIVYSAVGAQTLLPEVAIPSKTIPCTQGLYATGSMTVTSDANIYGSVYAGALYTGGTLVTSDARLKTNVRALQNALHSLTKLRGVRTEVGSVLAAAPRPERCPSVCLPCPQVKFQWRRDVPLGQHRPVSDQIGFIAQEVKSIVLAEISFQR